jgi:hypothetical protein
MTAPSGQHQVKEPTEPSGTTELLRQLEEQCKYAGHRATAAFLDAEEVRDSLL